jgi:peptidylprolyl isomerase/FKBP-type peptidyl-prolyl cis-trans isomerase FkpA
MKSLTYKEWVAVLAAVLFVVYAMFGQTIMNSFRRTAGALDNTASANPSVGEAQGFSGNVNIQDIVIGAGSAIEPGMTVEVNYVLKLSDGTVIQDSKHVNSGEPFSFVYGSGELIPGWEMGIAGMKTGGKRIIIVPPHLGYGPQAVGPIPANSTLIFEIELVSAKLF